MKIRTAAALVAALLLLAAGAYLGERATTARRASRSSHGPLLEGYDSGTVTRLEMRTGDHVSLLTRAGAGWVVAPDGLGADADAVADVLAKLGALDRRELAARNADRHAALGVDPGSAQSTTVKIWLGGDEPRFELRVGKVGPDSRSNFVRLEPETEVYLSHELVGSALDRGRRGFYDLRILEFAAGDVTRIAVRGGDQAWVAARTGAGWTLEQPASAGPVDTESLEALIATLADLTGDEPAAAAAQLGEVQARVTVTLRSGQTLELVIGDAVGDAVHVRRGDGDRLYRIFLERAPALVRSLDAIVRKGEGPSPTPAATAPTD